VSGTIHRFFVAPESVNGDVFAVPASIEHQVTRVLRLGPGAELVLLDGSGSELLCRMEANSDLRVLERRQATGEPRHRLVIWQALLKGDGLERVVQQGTELGVAEFRLLTSNRCVVRELSPRRLERLRAIGRESSEQSERGLVPPVFEPVPLGEALRPGAMMLFERMDGNGARMSRLDPPGEVIIGPEGGFDAYEVAQAERSGVVLAGLGPRILRAESVAIAAAAVVLSRTGDFA
jgi:16S rRNA (uracil1498-N3)-methyltransferase